MNGRACDRDFAIEGFAALDLWIADLDPLGQKLEEDTDSERQEPTLPKIDRMQFVEVTRIERLENRDKPIGGNIILDPGNRPIELG